MWDDLRDWSNRIQVPWAVVGNFYVILATKEKKGGRPYKIEKCMDFLNCIDVCKLADVGYSGAKYIWSDNRKAPKIIWKRFDRLLINAEWLDLFNETGVQLLARVTSDLNPLMISMTSIEKR